MFGTNVELLLTGKREEGHLGTTEFSPMEIKEHLIP